MPRKSSRYWIIFLFRYGIDVVCIQEHNISNVANVPIIDEYYLSYINTCYQLKGGTAILMRKKSGIKVVRVDLYASSRIMYIKCCQKHIKGLKPAVHYYSQIRLNKLQLWLDYIQLTLTGINYQQLSKYTLWSHIHSITSSNQ